MAAHHHHHHHHHHNKVQTAVGCQRPFLRMSVVLVALLGLFEVQLLFTIHRHHHRHDDFEFGNRDKSLRGVSHKNHIMENDAMYLSLLDFLIGSPERSSSTSITLLSSHLFPQHSHQVDQTNSLNFEHDKMKSSQNMKNNNPQDSFANITDSFFLQLSSSSAPAYDEAAADESSSFDNNSSIFSIKMATSSRRRISCNLSPREKNQLRDRLRQDPAWPLLPPWAQDYFIWHAEMRQQYPDDKLLTDPHGPGVIVKLCTDPEDCGGTHDRLGQIENFIAFASFTNRVALIKWHYPVDLEHFLVPNLVNWTVPAVPEFSKQSFVTNRITDFAKGRKGNTNNKMVPLAQWAKKSIKRKIIIKHKNILPEHIPQREKMGLDQDGVFGAIFRSLFRPSASVQTKLNEIYKQLGLSAGQYTATHCRVRHPGFFGFESVGKDENKNADASGLVFEGEYKKKAIKAAMEGIQCTTELLESSDEPIYFMSDSDELVHYVVNNTKRNDQDQSQIDAALAKLTKSCNVVARDVSAFPTLHIDRQLGYPPEYYTDTFVDLYLAVNARCISFGVGNFAFFAAKISGTTCTQVHKIMRKTVDRKKWNQQTGGASICKTKAHAMKLR